MTRRTVAATERLLSLFYSVVIAAAGYFIFAGKWVGTPVDFTTAFFWAYAIDVGVDAATSAAKSVQRG